MGYRFFSRQPLAMKRNVKEIEKKKIKKSHLVYSLGDPMPVNYTRWCKLMYCLSFESILLSSECCILVSLVSKYLEAAENFNKSNSNSQHLQHSFWKAAPVPLLDFAKAIVKTTPSRNIKKPISKRRPVKDTKQKRSPWAVRGLRYMYSVYCELTCRNLHVSQVYI